MSLMHVNRFNQKLCEECGKKEVIAKVHVMNRGDYFSCDHCSKMVAKTGAYQPNKIKYNEWTPKETWHRKMIEMEAGDQLYIVTRHHTLRIFTVGDDFHQSTDIHVVSDTNGMETKKLQFTSKGRNDLEDTKFLCFSTVESEDD